MNDGNVLRKNDSLENNDSSNVDLIGEVIECINVAMEVGIEYSLKEKENTIGSGVITKVY